MTTFADLFSSLKDELAARYRSPFWGTALIVLTAYHWKIIVFFLTEKQSAKDTIAFIEANVSGASIAAALAFALCYVIAFPWVELAIAFTASFGIRTRNDFHTKERELEIGRRKIIAQQQAQLIEAELKNKSDQSMLTDIELARSYQNMLSGENFVRWMKDVQSGAVNNNLSNSIYNYLNKVDSVEGKFINPAIESAHVNFVNNLSTLASVFSNGNLEARLPELTKFSQNVLDSHQVYRGKVRELLGI